MSEIVKDVLVGLLVFAAICALVILVVLASHHWKWIAYAGLGCFGICALGCLGNAVRKP